LATITATTQGTHIARTFVPAPPLVSPLRDYPLARIAAAA
jgi:hypothetical protein